MVRHELDVVVVERFERAVDFTAAKDVDLPSHQNASTNKYPTSTPIKHGDTRVHHTARDGWHRPERTVGNGPQNVEVAAHVDLLGVVDVVIGHPLGIRQDERDAWVEAFVAVEGRRRRVSERVSE